jgi:hypothetical protein
VQSEQIDLVEVESRMVVTKDWNNVSEGVDYNDVREENDVGILEISIFESFIVSSYSYFRPNR